MAFSILILAKIEHTLTMCVILSVFLLLSLHIGVSLVLSIYSIDDINSQNLFLICTQKAFYLMLEFPAFEPFPSPSIISAFCFSQQLTVKSFLFSFNRMLFSPLRLILNICKLFKFSSVVPAMISFPLILKPYSAKISVSSFRQSSMLASPLPPSLFGRYNHLPFELGCSPPYMVIIFLVFRSLPSLLLLSIQYC